MKVRYKTSKAEIEVEGSDVKDAFVELAGAIEVFGSSTCGACDSTNTMPQVRDVQGNTYYEMRCQDCGSALSFGQTKVGNRLYPRRKGKDGSYLPGNGWVKFQPKAAADEPF